MNNNFSIPITLLTFAVLAGCSSVPPSNPLLEEARNNYNNAEARPHVSQLAPLELKQASESLDAATHAWKEREDNDLINHLAYIAKQRVAIAEETANQKTAELIVANSSTERDRVRLEARTREADAAQRSAQASQLESEQAKQQAEASQRESEEAKRLAQTSQTESQEAKLAAENAQREAAAEKQAAGQAELSAQAALQQSQEAQNRALMLEADLKDMETQLKDMEAKKTDRGMVITLGDVVFGTNKAQLKSGGMRNVEKLAEFLKKYPDRKVMIEGFTDSTGSDDYNQQLSDKRASGVRSALINMGVEADRITAKGYGESFPVANNSNSTGRQLNRRVEVIVSDEVGTISPRPGI